MDDDLFHVISALARRAVDRYSVIATARGESDAVDRSPSDPAARWVLIAAVAGRPLPINPATARALEVAVAELELVR